MRPVLSLNTKLVAGCMVMLGFSLILSISLITIFSGYYSRANRDLVLLTTFKRVLIAAVEISAERGPMNQVIDEEPAVTSPHKERLTQFRAKADAALAAILEPVPGVIDRQQDADLVALVDRTRNALVNARHDVDSLVSLPKSARSSSQIIFVLRGMFDCVDLVRPIATRTMAKIVAKDQSLAGPAIMALMLVELREFTGRLGSQLIPFISAKEPLSETTIVEIAQTRERILGLWDLVGSQLGLYAFDAKLDDYRQQVKAKYFGQGLQLIDQAIATGRLSGAYGITTTELTDRYVPDLQPINQLRNGFLDSALDNLASEQFSALIWLSVVSIVAVLIVAATLALIFAARHYVLGPLMSAYDTIVALSNGMVLGELKSPTPSQEMVRLFDAIEGLRMLLSEREQHTERLKILSETDGLTGLVNRRLFDRIGQGDAEFNNLSRDVSVIMMDLDRFKGINDTYGHLAGDQVLKRAATIVQRVCRKTDVAARYGGEEISIIVFESDPWVAMHVAERIRVELEAEPIVLPDGRSIRATASFGVAHGKRGTAQWLSLVKSADGALYEAKEAGRNRVCRASINPAKPKRSVA